jgi:hypothetical protein
MLQPGEVDCFERFEHKDKTVDAADAYQYDQATRYTAIA